VSPIKFPCPSCGAQVDQACRRKGGGTTLDYHERRRDAAIDAARERSRRQGFVEALRWAHGRLLNSRDLGELDTAIWVRIAQEEPRGRV